MTVRRAIAFALAVTASCVAVVAGGVGVDPASAHAALVGSNPASDAVLADSPKQITLRFNERVSLPDDAVRLLDVDGNSVALGRVRVVDLDVVAAVPTSLDDGSYVVAWKVVSADAHPVSGAFTFAVGAADADTGATQAAVLAAGTPHDGAGRALEDVAAVLAYGGVLLAVGLAVYGATVPAAPELRRLIAVTSVVGAVGLVGVVGAEAVLVGGGLADQVTGSPGVQCAMGLVGLGLVWTRRRPLALIGGLVAVSAFAVVGHTRVATPIALTIAVDVVHLAAASVWTGGLLALLIHLRRTEDPVPAASAVARFSSMAAVALVAVAAAGAVLAWRVLESWGALVHTTYGVMLLVKVGLFAVLASIGGFNRFALVGRVRSADDQRPWRLLRRTLVAEIVVAAVIVGVTGVLTSTSPNDTSATDALAVARRKCLDEVAAMRALPGMENMDHSCPGDPTTTSSAPFDPTDVSSKVVSDRFGDGTIVMTLAPARVGSNELEVDLLDASGKPLDTPEPPTVELRLRARGVGPITQTATRVGPGTYKVNQDLPLAGTWEVNVSAVVSDFDQPQAIGEITVTG